MVECYIILGKGLAFETVPQLDKSAFARDRLLAAGDPFALAGEGAYEGARPHVVVGGFDVSEFGRRYGRRLRLADLIEKLALDKVRTTGGESSGHVHTECPFEHNHSHPGEGTGTMAINAEDAETEHVQWFCRHDSCAGVHWTEMVGQALADGWFTPEDLTRPEFLAGAADEEYEDEATEEDAERGAAMLAAATAVTAETPYADLRAILATLYSTSAGDPRPLDATKEDWDKRKVLTKTGFNKLLKEVEHESKAAHWAESQKDAFFTDGGRGFKAGIANGWKVIADRNAAPGGPDVFFSGNAMVTLTRDPYTETRQAVELTSDALTTHLTKFGNWRQKVGDGSSADVEAPPRFAVHLLNDMDPPKEACPRLEGIISAPVFGPSGWLILDDGYDEESGYYLAKPKGFVVPPVPESPTEAEVAAAREVLVDVFADIPFAGGLTRDDLMGGAPSADLSHILGWMFTPLIRSLLGSTALAPALYIGKSDYGAGASLALKVAQIIVAGGSDLRPTLPRNEDSQHKEIVAALASDQHFLCFDNATLLAGAPLAALLTASNYSGRTLGYSETRVYPNRISVAFTGANAVAAKEIQRRLIMAWIDPAMAAAHERSGFKYADLEAHARDKRGVLYGALCTLVAHWIDQGGLKKLRGEQTADDPMPVLGSYETWCRAVGQILSLAKIGGFLTNRAEVARRMSDTSDADDAGYAFVEAWAKSPKPVEGTEMKPFEEVKAVTRADELARNLAEFADALDLDLDVKQRPKGVMGMGFDPREFGRWLGRIAGRVYMVDGKPYRVIRSGDPRAKGGTRWTLEEVPVKGGKAAD